MRWPIVVSVSLGVMLGLVAGAFVWGRRVECPYSFWDEWWLDDDPAF